MFWAGKTSRAEEWTQGTPRLQLKLLDNITNAQTKI